MLRRNKRQKGSVLLVVLIALVAVEVVLAGSVVYFSKKSSLLPVACTQEAKQCSDGSYVGRTGPNCEFAVCPGVIEGNASSSQATSTAQSTSTGLRKANTGILIGTVSIGPICPVERVGVPCPVPPEAYSIRQFLVLTSDRSKTIASFYANASGNYSISLTSGTYVVISAKTGIGFISKDLPATVTIKADTITKLDISVDTGIR